VSQLVEITDIGDDGVGLLTLTRPDKKNALSISVRDQMSDALDALASDERLRALVVTGAGDTFCAGFDLDEFADPQIVDELWASSDRWHRTVLQFPLPTIAAVNGGAYGGGFDLAVMCTLRVAGKSARFAHPEHAFSQVVYAPLHDLVGGAIARDLALTGRRIDVAEAERLGLVSRVVPASEVVTEARAVAAEIARAPRDVLLLMIAKIHRRAGILPGATLDL
jgi:enoyl-CoA hydratase/carnithine racemase